MENKQSLSSPNLDAWDRGASAITNFISNWRLKVARRGLESQLAEALRIANGHKNKGKPAGHACYQELWKRVDEKIRLFCEEWKVERLTIESEAPQLAQLYQWAHPAPPTPPAAKAMGIFAMGLAAAFVIGVTTGIMTLGYHFVVHWIH